MTCTPEAPVPITATLLPSRSHRRMRPPRRVIRLPLERLDALDLGPDRVREGADACYQEPASVSAPVPQFDLPASARIVIVCRLHLARKLDVGSKVELVGYVLQVPQDFRLPREVLRPVPLVQQLLRERNRHMCSSPNRTERPGTGSSTTFLPHPFPARTPAPSGPAPSACTTGTARRCLLRSQLHRNQGLSLREPYF